jgi:hypothetical protein
LTRIATRDHTSASTDIFCVPQSRKH